MPTPTAFTHSFCLRWLKKASRCSPDRLDEAFDRFFTLFVAYNRLYSQLGEVAARPERGDHAQATRVYADIVGRDQLWTDLLTARLDEDLATIAAMIGPLGSFNITFDRASNSPDTVADARLSADLLHGAPPARVDAILELLYQVRCNLFHGRKGFEARQLELLQPCTRCLRSVIDSGMLRLQSIV